MEGNVLFNDALNTFYLRLYGVRHNGKGHTRDANAQIGCSDCDRNNTDNAVNSGRLKSRKHSTVI